MNTLLALVTAMPVDNWMQCLGLSYTASDRMSGTWDDDRTSSPTLEDGHCLRSPSTFVDDHYSSIGARQITPSRHVLLPLGDGAGRSAISRPAGSIVTGVK